MSRIFTEDGTVLIKENGSVKSLPYKPEPDSTNPRDARPSRKKPRFKVRIYDGIIVADLSHNVSDYIKEIS